MKLSLATIATEPELLLARAELGSKIAEIDRRLATLKAQADDASMYTSLRLPPDMRHLKNGRRAFAEFLRAHDVPGATREGHVWSCPRHPYHEVRRHRAPVALVQRESAAPDDDAAAAKDLEACGLRAPRRSA